MTLHFRRAPEHEDWVLAFAERQHEARGLMVVQGRHERELRPPLDVDKGTVVRALVAEHDGAGRAVAGRGGLRRRRRRPARLRRARRPRRARTPARLAPHGGAGGRRRPESPASVAAAADLTVPGATGAVALLRELADAAGASPAVQR